ncbi:efflux RND transporter periplasmic adaptor subunit [Sphingomonas sp. MMS24-J45]|uniref:efflux RND transporter periplasmic adaptor subunit n=1 Tax=Sphingomonas sp. MMS24-J45 TaxID=3238806 RepID=UPI00384D8179
MTRKSTVLLTALLLGACSGAAEEEEAGSAPVALVSLGRAEPGALAEQVTLYGSVEAGPGGRLTVSAPAEATVVSIAAPVGTRVAAGAVVAQLAASPTTEVELVKARSDAQAANAALARAERLRADGLGSNAEVETARATATSANATRVAMAARTGALTLRAPSAGIVETVTASPGDLVQPGAAIATITRASDFRARFGVDPALARILHPGSVLHIVASGVEATFDVPVETINPAADPQTRLASVFARIPAATGIGAGQTVRATADGAAQSAAQLTIPYAALLDDGGQAYVYVVAGGVAHRRDITVGAVRGDRVAVSGSVRAGDAVVVAGGTAVEDDMKVRTK